MLTKLAKKLRSPGEHTFPTTRLRVAPLERLGEARHFRANRVRVQPRCLTRGRRGIPLEFRTKCRDPRDAVRARVGEMKRDVSAHAVPEHLYALEAICIEPLEHILREMLNAERARAPSLAAMT